MGRKNLVLTYNMLEDADLSGDLLSPNTVTANLDKCSIQINWTGASPSGDFTVEATNSDPTKPASDWVTLDFGSTISVSGNTGDHELIFNELPFRAFRLRYTSTSGTGSVNAVLSAKVTGA